MTSQTDQLQTLINEIDAVLGKASPRLPWVMSAEAAEQRKVLEQTRLSLLSLQQQMQVEAAQAPQASMAAAPLSEESAQHVLQALLQEMNYLRRNMVQPLRADIDRLTQERTLLAQELQQLQAQRQQMALPGGGMDQKQMMDSFMAALMERLQETLSEQVAQTLSQYEAEARAIAASPEMAALPPGEMPLLSPSQRLAQIRQTQARSDQLLLKLDSTLQVIFESLQSNLQGYQESLAQGLEKMHGLGQQGEAMFSGLVNRLAQQLGREASSYLQTALEAAVAEEMRSPSQLPNRARVSETAQAEYEQIDRLLDELNGETTADLKAETASPFALSDLVGSNDLDGDITVFQIDERRLPRYDEGEDITVFQTREDVEFAQIVEAARRQQRATAQPSPTEPPASGEAIAPNLADADATLDWLGQINDRQDADNPPLPDLAIDGASESADPATVDVPENLYEDDFYNSLFGETDAESVAESGVEALPATATEDLFLTPEPDLPLLRRSVLEDEVLSEPGREDDLFGGLTDPAQALSDGGINLLGEEAEEDTPLRMVESEDDDLSRDESLSSLSTQTLQGLFPDDEPLFDEGRFNNTVIIETDEPSGLPVLDDAPAPALTDAMAAIAPEDMVATLTELIEQDESLVLDTSSPLSGEEDQYMAASPDEDLLGNDELGVDAEVDLLQVDDRLLNQLEADLSTLETEGSEEEDGLSGWADESVGTFPAASAAPWVDEDVTAELPPGMMPRAAQDEILVDLQDSGVPEPLPNDLLAESWEDVPQTPAIAATSPEPAPSALTDSEEVLLFNLEQDQQNRREEAAVENWADLAEESQAEILASEELPGTTPEEDNPFALTEEDFFAAPEESVPTLSDRLLDEMEDDWEDTRTYLSSDEVEEPVALDRPMDGAEESIFGGWEVEPAELSGGNVSETEEADVYLLSGWGEDDDSTTDADRDRQTLSDRWAALEAMDDSEPSPATNEINSSDLSDTSAFFLAMDDSDDTSALLDEFGDEFGSDAPVTNEEAEALFESDQVQSSTLEVDDLLLPEVPTATPSADAEESQSVAAAPINPSEQENVSDGPSIQIEPTLADWFLSDDADPATDASPETSEPDAMGLGWDALGWGDEGAAPSEGAEDAPMAIAPDILPETSPEIAPETAPALTEDPLPGGDLAPDAGVAAMVEQLWAEETEETDGEALALESVVEEPSVTPWAEDWAEPGALLEATQPTDEAGLETTIDALFDGSDAPAEGLPSLNLDQSLTLHDLLDDALQLGESDRPAQTYGEENLLTPDDRQGAPDEPGYDLADLAGALADAEAASDLSDPEERLEDSLEGWFGGDEVPAPPESPSEPEPDSSLGLSDLFGDDLPGDDLPGDALASNDLAGDNLAGDNLAGESFAEDGSLEDARGTAESLASVEDLFGQLDALGGEGDALYRLVDATSATPPPSLAEPPVTPDSPGLSLEALFGSEEEEIAPEADTLEAFDLLAATEEDSLDDQGLDLFAGMDADAPYTIDDLNQVFEESDEDSAEKKTL